MSTNAIDQVGLHVNPIFATVDVEANAHRELVFLYGYISKVTDSTIRIHQGLKLGSYLEIPRSGIVYAEPDSNDQLSSLTKLVLYADTMIDDKHGEVRTSRTAGILASAIDLYNHERGRPIDPAHMAGRTSVPAECPCPGTCIRNGTCICDPCLHDHPPDA